MARITKTQLDRYSAIARETAELGRKVRALQSEAKAIANAAQADLTSSGKPSIMRGGYRIDWTEGRLSIAWKDELISRLGADVANAITSAAPVKRSLRITPPEAVKAVVENSKAEAHA